MLQGHTKGLLKSGPIQEISVALFRSTVSEHTSKLTLNPCPATNVPAETFYSVMEYYGMYMTGLGQKFGP